MGKTTLLLRGSTARCRANTSASLVLWQQWSIELKVAHATRASCATAQSVGRKRTHTAPRRANLLPYVCAWEFRARTIALCAGQPQRLAELHALAISTACFVPSNPLLMWCSTMSSHIRLMKLNGNKCCSSQGRATSRWIRCRTEGRTEGKMTILHRGSHGTSNNRPSC